MKRDIRSPNHGQGLPAKALPTKRKTWPAKAEVEALRAHLAEALAAKAEAEETLRAIRQGEVDALLIDGPGGPQTFTLRGADRAYEVLVEGMNEGALTVSPAGLLNTARLLFSSMMSPPAW